MQRGWGQQGAPDMNLKFENAQHGGLPCIGPEVYLSQWSLHIHEHSVVSSTAAFWSGMLSSSTMMNYDDDVASSTAAAFWSGMLSSSTMMNYDDVASSTAAE